MITIVFLCATAKPFSYTCKTLKFIELLFRCSNNFCAFSDGEKGCPKMNTKREQGEYLNYSIFEVQINVTG